MTPYGFPPESYHCLLDEQPHYLTPERLLPEVDLNSDFIVNPGCWFSWHGPLPADKANRIAFADNLAESDWMVWVDDPATGAIWPFWIGVDFSPYLTDMEPGAVCDLALPDDVKTVLAHAGVLVPPGYAAQRRRDWLDALWDGAGQFAEGYVSVAGLIHPFHIGALRRYNRYHTRAGTFALGDEQVSRRFASHNEPAARFFHFQLTQAMADLAGAAIQPSYCYSVIYQDGAELHKHTDREACEYSITLCIDATPEPGADEVPWPIQLETARGEEEIFQHIGDALSYRGREVPHWRTPLESGRTSSSLLFHYVDEAFPGVRS